MSVSFTGTVPVHQRGDRGGLPVSLQTHCCVQICLKDQWSISAGQTVPPGLRDMDVKFKRCKWVGGSAQFHLSAQCPLLRRAFLLTPNDKEWKALHAYSLPDMLLSVLHHS